MNRLVLLFFLLPFGLFAQDTLTIEEAIQIALEKNYSIRIAQRNKDAAVNNYTLGNAGFLPTLSLNAGKTYNINNSRNVSLISFDSLGRPRVQDRRGARSENLQYGANLNWTIFNGLGMFATYSRLAELRRSGFDSLQVVVENSVATLSNAYYNVVQQAQRLNVLTNTLKISAQRLDLAKAQYEVGSGSKMNYLAAQVDYNSDSSAVVLQGQLLQNAKVALNQSMSREAGTPFTVIDTIIVNEALDLETLRQTTIRNNPSLLLFQHRSNAAYQNIKIQQSQRYPVVNLFLGYNYSQTNAQTGNFSLSRNAGVNYGVSATMNVFNGFNQNRIIQNAKIQREVAEYRFKDLQVQLDASLEVAYNNYRNSLNLISIEKKNLEIAQQNVDIALERYKVNGSATYLELRNIQLNAIQTAGRLIDAIYNTKLAEIELMRLSSDIIKETPKQ